MLAQLVVGVSIDDSGRPQPLGPEAIEQAWRQLRTSHPEEFRPKADSLVKWHRRQLLTSEVNQEWSAAAFHLQRLTELSPNDRVLQQVRARVLACQPLPRDPLLSPNLIDLTDYYNTSLAENWERQETGKNMAELGTGVQLLAGVKFDIRGAVRLADREGQYLDRHYPLSVPGIPVAQRCRRLHFLQASEGASKIDGTRLGSYVVHYVNHQAWQIPIVYGEDLRDWYTQPGESDSAARAEVAWRGDNAASRRSSTTGETGGLRLYKRTWDNPVPDVEIESIDFVLNSGPAQPFLLAITAE
jgi:hypothetical protein